MKKVLYIVLLAAVFVSFGTRHSFAQGQAYEGQEQINYVYFNSTKEVEGFFAGRTFWNRKVSHRLYFGTDGQFVYQYFTDFGDYKRGQALYGNWQVPSQDEVCWTIGQGDNKSAPICYEVRLGPESRAHVPYYIHNAYLFYKGDPTGKTHIYLDARIPGKVILSQEHMEEFWADIDTMTARRIALREAGGIPEKPYEDISQLSPDIQSYLKDTLGKVMALPLSYIITYEDGTFLSMPRIFYDSGAADIEALKEQVGLGRWSIEGNVQCWQSASVRYSRRFPDRTVPLHCHSVYKNTGLDHSYYGYLTHVQNGYSRIFDASTIIPLEDMENPEALNPQIYQ